MLLGGHKRVSVRGTVFLDRARPGGTARATAFVMVQLRFVNAGIRNSNKADSLGKLGVSLA